MARQRAARCTLRAPAQPAKTPVSEDSQIDVPESFIALFRRPGRSKLSASRDDIAARYGFCEDLAQVLIDHARDIHHGQGIDEDEVLRRCLCGLMAEGSGVDAAEGVWVVRRLAELLDWPDPGAALSATAQAPG